MSQCFGGNHQHKDAAECGGNVAKRKRNSLQEEAVEDGWVLSVAYSFEVYFPLLKQLELS
jgi:hypothetical protein